MRTYSFHAALILTDTFPRHSQRGTGASPRHGGDSLLAALDQRLGTMPPDELKAAVVDFARTLAPDHRQAFLDHFHATAPAPRDEEAALAAAIDVLEEEEAARTGEPEWGEQDEARDRYGWSIDDELAEPDWAPELRGLLGRAGGLCVTGESASAAGAYERLFRVVGRAVDAGWSIGSDRDDPEALHEAAARYLRVLWEVTGPAERPGRLRAAVTELSVLVGPADLSLSAVAAAGPSPPVDGARFVADWVTALNPIANAPDAGAWAHRLLIEGVAALEGPDGLADLARAGGSRAGDVYVAWVDTARSWGLLDQAGEAAAEGLRALPSSPQRAALAERLASLADNAGDVRSAMEARLEAWVSGPSLDRMLAVVHAARQAGSEAEAVASLAERAEEAAVAPATRVALFLLAGRLEAAMAAEAEASDPVRGGWVAADATAVLVPALLTAAVDATRHQGFARLVLAALLRRWDHGVGDSVGRVRYEPDGPPLPAHDLSLGELLIEALGNLELAAEHRRALFDKATCVAADAVASIVEAKARRLYRVAAGLAITHAEAVALLHGQAAGDAAAAEAEARYPRHSAYRYELADARGRSPVLSTPAPRR